MIMSGVIYYKYLANNPQSKYKSGRFIQSPASQQKIRNMSYRNFPCCINKRICAN